MQDGMIDFEKNRAQYRREKGLGERDLDSQELESQIREKDVEDQFVMVDQQRRDLEMKQE